MVRYYI